MKPIPVITHFNTHKRTLGIIIIPKGGTFLKNKSIKQQ